MLRTSRTINMSFFAIPSHTRRTAASAPESVEELHYVRASFCRWHWHRPCRHRSPECIVVWLPGRVRAESGRDSAKFCTAEGDIDEDFDLDSGNRAHDSHFPERRSGGQRLRRDRERDARSVQERKNRRVLDRRRQLPESFDEG